MKNYLYFKKFKYSIFFEYLLIFFGLFAHLLLTWDRQPIGDGLTRFETLSNLLNNGNLDDSKYSIMGPIFASPLWYIGRFFGDSGFCCMRFNLILLVLGIFFLSRILSELVSPSLGRTFAIILIYGSMFGKHVQEFYGEVFTSILFAIGTATLIFGKHKKIAAFATIISVVNTPASALGLFLIGVYNFIKKRSLWFITIASAAGCLILLESQIRRGSPFSSGYTADHGSKTLLPFSGEPGFSYPFILGLFSILLSFGKGLVFFAPSLFVTSGNLRANFPKLVSLWETWILSLIGLVLVYSKWWSWYGGWFWGPRFFLFASIPASLGLALCWEPSSFNGNTKGTLGKLLPLGLLTCAFWVGISGSIFDQEGLEVCFGNNYLLESFCWYLPEFSVLVRPFLITHQYTSSQTVFISASLLTYAWLSIKLLNGRKT